MAHARSSQKGPQPPCRLPSYLATLSFSNEHDGENKV